MKRLWHNAVDLAGLVLVAVALLALAVLGDEDDFEPWTN